MPGDTRLARPVDPEVGQRIRRRRRELGLTQAQVACPEYTRVHVARIEAGHGLPSRRALALIAGRLETSEEWILTGVDTADRERWERSLEEGIDLLRDGRAADAAAVLADVVREAVPGALRESARVWLAYARCAGGQPTAAVDVLTGDRGWAALPDRGLVGRGHYTLGWALLQTDDAPAAIDALDDARQVLDEDGADQDLRCRTLTVLADAHHLAGELVSATRMLHRATSVADGLDDVRHRARIAYAASLVAESEGEAVGALRHARSALRLFRRLEDPTATARLRLQIAQLLLDLDRPADARSELDRVDRARWMPLDRDRLTHELARGRLAMADERLADAASAFEAARQLAHGSTVTSATAEVEAWLAQLALRAGDHATALRAAQTVLETAPRHATVMRETATAVRATAAAALGAGLSPSR
jgi:tetratricopeptide (TPR) repeat protein